jgi:diguanylate cyclase (GGDEF)-like protein
MTMSTAPGPLAYEAISLRGIKELAMRGWAAGIVLACVLMIFAPPTAQIGAAGWPAGITIQALSALGLILFVRHKQRAGFGVLLVITWALPIDLAMMQWLAGGWSAPYHELLLPALILGSAGLPPRRFAVFAGGVVVIAMLPAVYAPDRQALLGIVTELSVWLFVATALAMLMARVRGQARLARSDSLTGLANRRALDELLARPRHQPVVLAIGDLDDFKRINDDHGHLAGDACLASVAGALSRGVRPDDRVFRWAGDEFAVLLPGATALEAETLLDRLETAVRETVCDPTGMPVEITFGWAAGAAGADPRDLTDQADTMLLERKAARKRGEAPSIDNATLAGHAPG